MPKQAGESDEPASWITARYASACASCGQWIEAGDPIRATDDGGFESVCCDDDSAPARRDPFVGTSTDKMGY